MSESPAHRRPGLIALVAIGGVAGTFARHGLGQAFPHSQGDWPITAFLINVAGAFALGLLLEALTRLGAPDAGTAAPRAASSLRMLRLGMGTGVLGAFTTYST
ncbi:MAG: CrcB family protein, partial [Tomitella sp.]|nr:CrcB family protein [Tomitella sp.]